MEQIFEIIITSCKNSTWQGELRGGGQVLPFGSDLELLLDLNRLCPTEQRRRRMGNPPPAAEGE